MITQPLTTVEAVKAANGIGVHAVTVSASLMMNPDLNNELHIALNHI